MAPPDTPRLPAWSHPPRVSRLGKSATAELAPTHFGAVDGVIVAVYLLGSVAIGVWANRSMGRLSDFFVACRSIPASRW